MSRAGRASAHRPKVFVLGFHKTGTTSLKKALELLGYLTAGPNPELLDPILAGDWGPVDAAIADHDAFQDDPWFLAYERLESAYPDAHFILTVRDSGSWLRSVQGHFGNHVNGTRRAVYGDVGALDDPDHYIRCYEAHNRRVVDHFTARGRSLLVIDVTRDGWEPLCRHLGVEPPVSFFGRPIPLPHANAASTLDFRRRRPRLERVRLFFKDGFVRLFGPRSQLWLTALKYRLPRRN